MRQLLKFTIGFLIPVGCGPAPISPPTSTEPTELRFLIQPSDIGLGFPLDTVEIGLFDANGVLTNADDHVVSLEIYNSTGLLGTSEATSLGGRVVFVGLTVPDTSTETHLAASSPGLLAATSSSFQVFHPWVGLALGNVHACGATQMRVYCWGNNLNGRLGTGDNESRTIPSAVEGSDGFTNLLGGTLYMCASDDMQGIICWGDNRSGSFGNGNNEITNVPVPGMTTMSFDDISPGFQSSVCGLKDMASWCWGNGVNIPAAIEGGWLFSHISSGGSHACGVTPANAVACWGANNFGQLGSTIPSQPQPVEVEGMLYRNVSAGDDLTCGIRLDNAADCWGKNDDGQLGIGPFGSTATPTPVTRNIEWSMLSPGYDHSCGLDLEGSAYCWGSNDFGELGVGHDDSLGDPTSVQLPGVKFTDIVVGFRFSCGLVAQGDIYCWGNNEYGQLGIGSLERSLVPRRVLRPQ